MQSPRAYPARFNHAIKALFHSACCPYFCSATFSYHYLFWFLSNFRFYSFVNSLTNAISVSVCSNTLRENVSGAGPSEVHRRAPEGDRASPDQIIHVSAPGRRRLLSCQQKPFPLLERFEIRCIFGGAYLVKSHLLVYAIISRLKRACKTKQWHRCVTSKDSYEKRNTLILTPSFGENRSRCVFHPRRQWRISFYSWFTITFHTLLLCSLHANGFCWYDSIAMPITTIPYATTFWRESFGYHTEK